MNEKPIHIPTLIISFSLPHYRIAASPH